MTWMVKYNNLKGTAEKLISESGILRKSLLFLTFSIHLADFTSFSDWYILNRKETFFFSFFDPLYIVYLIFPHSLNCNLFCLPAFLLFEKFFMNIYESDSETIMFLSRLMSINKQIKPTTSKRIHCCCFFPVLFFRLAWLFIMLLSLKKEFWTVLCHAQIQAGLLAIQKFYIF